MRSVRGTWTVLVVLGTSLACGRPATKADCELIVDRTVELTMNEMSNNNREAVERKKTELHTKLQATVLTECVGRRISDKTMACVRSASTVKQLEGCLK